MFVLSSGQKNMIWLGRNRKEGLMAAWSQGGGYELAFDNNKPVMNDLPKKVLVLIMGMWKHLYIMDVKQ